MEKYKFYIMLLMMVWVTISCRRDDRYTVEVPVSNIVLVAPHEQVLIDLNDMAVDAYAFQWNKSENEAYSLVLSKDEMLTDPVYFDAGSNNSISIPTESLDVVASDFGFGNGAVGTVYWAVKPKNHIGIASKEVRSIQVKRLISRLLAPENQTNIKLNSEQPSSTVSFVWDTEGEDGANTYSVLFSDNKEMTGETVSIDVGAVNSAGITHGQLQDVFIQYANHPFKVKRIFWNVKRNQDNVMLARSGAAVDIDPMLIFRDVRGDEVITYKVAKIVYSDGRQQYWLAENLRATKYADGTDIETANVMFAPSGTFTPEQIKAFGGYYRANPTMFNKLPSTGWRIPTIDEYRTLYEAADIQEGTYNVLRSPVFYNYEPTKSDPKVNKWNLGLVTAGQQQGEDKVVTNTTFCYMMATGIGEDTHRAAMLDHFAIWEVWSVGTNVRLIYND